MSVGTVFPEIAFAAPPERLVLGPVHIWRLVTAEIDLLSNAERVRSERFLSGPARNAFIAGRSGLRLVASLYSKIAPRDLLLETDANGKPYFANAAVHFNLSHSGGAVVAAFSGSAVGIDIESRGRCRDFVGIANRFFHPAEAETIFQSKDESQFLRLWTWCAWECKKMTNG